MANEAVLLQEYSLPINMTCASSTTIEQGAILKIADPNTASISTATEDYIAGIAAEEKDGSDTGKTSVAVYIDGVFDLKASGSITAGQAVVSAATTESNTIKVATATAVGCKTLGIALETASDGETIAVRLQPGCNNTAYS